MCKIKLQILLTVFDRQNRYKALPFKNIPHDPRITKMIQVIIYPASNGSRMKSLKDGFSTGLVNLQTKVE